MLWDGGGHTKLSRMFEEEGIFSGVVTLLAVSMVPLGADSER